MNTLPHSALPLAFFMSQPEGWSHDEASAEHLYQLITNPECSAAQANSFVLFAPMLYSSHVQAWTLWMIAKHPAFRLFLLEEPSMLGHMCLRYASFLRTTLPRIEHPDYFDYWLWHFHRSFQCAYPTLPREYEFFQDGDFRDIPEEERMCPALPLARFLDAIEMPDLFAVLCAQEAL